jgi:hypothetical protein
MYKGVGAYFGNTRIVEGAAGLGEYFAAQGLGADGELKAYADGTVGGNPADSATPGLLFAYHDGSLGAIESAAQNIGPLSSFADGILGGSPLDPSMPGPLNAYHDGSLGAYARAIGAAAQNLLDMGDPGVLKEVKSAMALMAPEVALTAAAQTLYTPEFYSSGIWEPEASILWQHVRDKAPSGSAFTADADSQVYPNAAGMGWMVGTLSAPQSGTYGPTYVKANLPALSAWYTAGGGTVRPPYLSLADKTKGVQGGTSMAGISPMVMYGLGAAALIGLYLIFRR